MQTENNHIYHLKDGRILAYDEINNGKLVELTKEEAVRLGLMKKYTSEKDSMTYYTINSAKPIKILYKDGKQYITPANTLNLRNAKDRQVAEKKYNYNTNLPYGNELVFQNGIKNSKADAITNAALAESTFGVKTGYINNATNGLYSDVQAKFGPLTVKDVMGLEAYRKLDNRGNPVTIMTHSMANHDFKDISKVNFYNEKFDNLSVVSLGSPESGSSVRQAANSMDIKYLGQVQDSEDPVAMIADGYNPLKSWKIKGKEHKFENYLKEPKLKNLINNEVKK